MFRRQLSVRGLSLRFEPPLNLCQKSITQQRASLHTFLRAEKTLPLANLRNDRRLYCTPTSDDSGLIGLLSPRFKIPPTDPVGLKFTEEQIRKMTFPPEKIRNFCIIAHIDHGKTTLSDAILRRTKVLPEDGSVGTFLDRLIVEKERGITIKAQTCSFFIKDPSGIYDGDNDIFLINLIDTPGHVDFTYEVSRSLSASDGAILLVDATQGVEAQTMANFYLAMEHDLKIIPALSKLDAAQNDDFVVKSLEQVEDATGEPENNVVFTAARAKRGVEAVLERVIHDIKPPSGKGADAPLRCLVFDAWSSVVKMRDGREEEGGVMCLCRIMDGTVKKDDVIRFYHSKKRFQVKSVGIMHPDPVPTAQLSAGQVGYIQLALGKRSEVQIGDTIYADKLAEDVEPVPGFKVVSPVIFASFYPADGEDYGSFVQAVEDLRVNDPSVTCEETSCPSLGRGLQLGCLGMLHMQVFQERLKAEFARSVLVAPPQVAFRYKDLKGNMQPLLVGNFVGKHEGAQAYFEPFVTITVITPEEYYSVISKEAVNNFRGEELDQKTVDAKRISIRYKMPLAELCRGFFTILKQETHGYAHLEYDDPEYEQADLVKVEILVNKASVTALSQICPREMAIKMGTRIISVLKDNMESYGFEVPIQAAIGSKVIARATVKAVKKDVTKKIRTDITRKMKKLNIQKEQAKMNQKSIGNVSLNQETLMAAMGVHTS